MDGNLLIKSNLILVAGLLFFTIYYLINIGNKYVSKERNIKINWGKILPIIIVIIIIILVILIIKRYNIVKETLNIILFSIIIAYILNPLVNYLEKRKLKRVWGILLVYILIFGIIVISILSFVPKMTKE